MNMDPVNCTLCDSRNICDEKHIIFEFLFLKDGRRNLLGKSVFRTVNVFTIRRFMSTKVPSKLVKLVKFL